MAGNSLEEMGQVGPMFYPEGFQYNQDIFRRRRGIRSLINARNITTWKSQCLWSIPLLMGDLGTPTLRVPNGRRKTGLD